ncbi:MAG TPA: hypothetical protein PLD95_00810 [bacterium]|jgi:hypothetical protein|nr:hypothetical protein [bacterium]HOG37994.1 hypothetical protein [bacterium]HQI03053.1 hypothetical protein [bacterium]
MVEQIKTHTKKRLPKSVRKYIARQKANIRKTFSDNLIIEEKIKELYSKFPKYK